MGTKIEWAEETWNCVTGCTRVSEGCDHCYIERTPPFRMQHRSFDKPGVGGTTGVKLHSERLHLPLRWKKPRRVFVNSLADLFHDEVPDDFIAEVFAVMALAPQHAFQLLTKRHARLKALLNKPTFPTMVMYRMYKRHPYGAPPVWPLPNVWVGVSVESQQWADIRIPALLDTPAAVRWLSCEPLLGPVDLAGYLPRPPDAPWYPLECRHGYDACPVCDRSLKPSDAISWVVAGGESGPRARAMHPDWARALRDQCTAAGVAYFFKQWGEWCDSGQMAPDIWSWLDSRINLGGEAHPEPHRIGKKRAGRLLDERTWDEYPGEVPL